MKTSVKVLLKVSKLFLQNRSKHNEERFRAAINIVEMEEIKKIPIKCTCCTAETKEVPAYRCNNCGQVSITIG